MTDNLIKQVEKLESKKSLLADEVSNLQQQSKSLEQGVKEKQELIDRLKKDVVAMQALKKDRAEDVSDLRKMRGLLEQEMENIKSSSERALEGEITKLLSEISDLELKKRNGLIELHDYKDSLKQKEEELECYEKELEKQEDRIKDQERKLRNESRELDHARDELFMWESQLEDMEYLLMTKEDKFTDYKHSTDESAKEMKQALQKLKEAVSLWRDRVVTLKFFSNMLEKRQNALDRLFIEIEQKKEALMDKERALKAAKKDLESIRKEVWL